LRIHRPCNLLHKLYYTRLDALANSLLVVAGATAGLHLASLLLLLLLYLVVVLLCLVLYVLLVGV
jgi:hypothetical protein